VNCQGPECTATDARRCYVVRLQAQLCVPCERRLHSILRRTAEVTFARWLEHTPSNGTRRPDPSIT